MKVYFCRIGCNIGFFWPFSTAKLERKWQMSKSKSKEKTQLTLNCTDSYHPFPPHSKMNFVHVFVTNNKRYSIDMNVAQYHLVHLNCGIWKLCLWNSKSRRNYIICCTVEKRRLSKIILFMESNYFPGFPFEGYLSHSGYCHRSCLLSSVIC